LRTPEVLDRVAWWDATGPSYRWSQIALAEMLASGLNANVASRHLALLHTALADAMIATWDSKEAHDRPRPATSDPTLATAAPTPPSSSYPDEHAVAGAAASTVLAEIFPERAAEFVRLAEEEAQTRLLAGLAYPSDVAAGTELGRQVAAAALEHAQGDGFDKPWTGSVPSEPGLWNGTNPVMPQASTWRPWLLASPDEFRPAPPPAYDSPERAAEMAELRAFERTPRSNAAVHFWEAAVGGLRNYEYWNLQAGRLLLESGQASDAPRAARVYALLNTAFYDAGVACWDAKYAYWTIRPVQLDPSFVTVVQTPNHPSYPAAHACYSLTAALVLAHLFPRDSEALTALGRESGTTRIWAGIHYPSDVAAGQRLAEQVAARAIERAQSDGAGF
jgi:membrane-associated phospholipid phosphatase